MTPCTANLPLYVTEWGVLDRQYFNETEAVTTYARQFMSVVEANRARVAAACWYGWGHGMDNGYGLVDFGGHPNQPLLRILLELQAGLASAEAGKPCSRIMALKLSLSSVSRSSRTSTSASRAVRRSFNTVTARS